MTPSYYAMSYSAIIALFQDNQGNLRYLPRFDREDLFEVNANKKETINLKREGQRRPEGEVNQHTLVP